MPRGKALPTDRNSRFRAGVADLVGRVFGGNKTAAAKAFGVTQGFLSDFLNGRRGAGFKLIEGVKKFDPALAAEAMREELEGQLLPPGVDGSIGRLIKVGESAEMATDVSRAAARVSGSSDPDELFQLSVAMLAVARAVISPHALQAASASGKNRGRPRH